MRVDVIDLGIDCRKCLTHAPDSAFTRWGDHIIAIRCRAVADDFGIDFCAAGFGMLEFFKYQDAGAACDHETVAVFVIGARGSGGCVIILRRHRTHRVEQL